MKVCVVKMSAAALLLMNSQSQMLDTACANRLLLKDDSICMTKADGFRVLKRKGWGIRGRLETVCHFWTGALGIAGS